MRILFLATGEIALPTFEWLLAPGGPGALALVTQPDKPVGRHQRLTPPRIKEIAARAGLPVLQPPRIREARAVESIRALAPDLLVVMAYGQILPPELLRVPRIACLNLHASLLPRHRGAACIQAAIRAGDRETGLTVMYMDEGLDTGDILLQWPVPIRRRETGGSLHDRLATLGPEVLGRALAEIASGRPPRTPQDPTLATYAPRLGREAGRIDWGLPREQIDRVIRAMNPWPSAFSELRIAGDSPKKLKIFGAILCRQSGARPGEILRADERGLLVACGSGSLLLRDVQLEGRKRMPAGEFLRGHPIPPGTFLGEQPSH